MQVKRAITEELKQSKILAYITALKKLCNHPKVCFSSFCFLDEGSGGSIAIVYTLG
jgi:DNA repair and recombination RAD54-like protein